MERQQSELVPIGDALADLGGPVQAIRDTSPQASHHFTQADQVNQLVGASEADPDLGFMGRTMALCSLPRSNPGNRLQYKRVNGPYKLIMIAGGDNKLPFGNLPRLLLAWLCSEAVKTRSRVLVLGPSLAKFMKTLGVYSSGGGRDQIKLRNQMRRLFGCTVQLSYKDEHGEAAVNSLIARRTEFWWNERKPDQPSLWESKIELGEDLFNEIISHPVPLDMNTLTALKRCSLGLDLYLWLTYRTFSLRAPQRVTWRQVYQQFRSAPGQGQRKPNRSELPIQGSPRVKEDQNRLAGVELRDGQRGLDPASFNPGYRPAQSKPANELISPFPASRRPVSGPAHRVGLLGMPHNPERPGGRKSLISTGLCDSGQFSTCKVETPQAHKYVQSGNMYPRKYVQSGNIYM